MSISLVKFIFNSFMLFPSLFFQAFLPLTEFPDIIHAACDKLVQIISFMTILSFINPSLINCSLFSLLDFAQLSMVSLRILDPLKITNLSLSIINLASL